MQRESKYGVHLVLGLAAILLSAAASAQEEAPLAADQEHEKLFLEDRFPSATTCATCHPQHYSDWSVSPHAYAQMSPVFNAMHGTVLKLTNGTNGDFCIRCHTPVGMNLEEPEFMSNMDRHPTSREGVTCVVCHRVNRAYGKLSGRLAIVEGDLFEPVYGPTGNDEVERVIDSSDYRVNPERGRAGRAIHRRAEPFLELTQSGFCGTCHDVNLINGFRLEEAFSEFKTSPAAREKISCQDCHMGKEPGVASGYAEGPAAMVGGKPTRKRKITDHMFIGPDYSVVHPGIFPHNTAASELATIRQWLAFDWQGGWGTDEFEAELPEGYRFPEHWQAPDDRYDARDILSDNQELLAEADRQRRKILQAGYQLGEIVVDHADEKKGLAFRVEVKNGTNGHGVPTGFDAERLVFLRVTVSDADGRAVFRSGDLDPNGDVRDNHSLYVHNGELPLDRQLFSLQGRFVTRMVRGGEREQVLAVNYSPDPLPFLRPSTSSTILTGRPLGARKHKQNIEPLGRRWARYRVAPKLLTGRAPYQVDVKIVAGMVPVNLIHEIKDVGFDYGMSAKEVAERVVAGHLVLWESSVLLAMAPAGAAESAAESAAGEEPKADSEKKDAHHSSELTDEHIPLQLEGFPERPNYLLELGNPYLGTGLIKPGIQLPTGAVWQPSLILFGTLRTALQSFDGGGIRFTELASRLDLFANLQLSGTERLVVGFRNLDQEGRFTSYILEPDPGDPAFQTAFGNDGDRFREELNAEIQSFYFEGDFGEIFPRLDAGDFGRSDVGFSIGRQPLLFQEGMLIQDSIDGIGLTRNTLLPEGTSNFRATLFVGVNEIHRANAEDRDAEMFALLTSTDFRRSTVDADLVYVRGGEASGDLLAGGISAVQRIGTRNTSFRILGSYALDEETAQATDGALVFGELSWTPHYTNDLVYFTAFVAVDEFSSAARGPATGGPLGRAGINFAAVGLGSYGAPLSSRARDVAGGAFGYQKFFGPEKRRQLLAEVGLRVGTASDVNNSGAATLRYQMAVGRRLVLVWDGFVGKRDGGSLAGDETLYGGRFELVVKF